MKINFTKKEELGTMKHLELHTRHIPVEHLKLDTPMGTRVQNNGMCDVLKPERLAQLKSIGVSVVETRLTWYELEPEPGYFDWSRLDRDIALIEAGGMAPAVFPWFQQTPQWEHQLVRVRCLEHDQENRIPSLWDTRLIEEYDRLYGALAEHYGKRLKYIQACCYSDYGEVLYPIGVHHYKFNSEHGHMGFWCGDQLARQDFRKRLQSQYGTITELNRNWGSSFGSWEEDLMPKLPFARNSLRWRIDFANWYSNALLEFTDQALAVMRKHFPEIEGGVALGFPNEPLEVGQIKSEVAKLAAKYDLTPRWTGTALFRKDVARSNLQARRISSAARFYGNRFGTEATLELRDPIPAICELAANGATLFHNDPGNFTFAPQSYSEWLPKIPAAMPVCTPVAVFYPVEGEFCHCLESDRNPEPEGENDSGKTQKSSHRRPIEKFLDSCVELRRQCDFELLDTTLIADGALEQFKLLILPCALPVPEATTRRIGEWVKRGGTLLFLRDRPPRILETSVPLHVFAEQAGFPVSSVDHFPDVEPFAALQREFGEDTLTFWHGDSVTLYYPEQECMKNVTWKEKKH